jgi:CRP-like cAMP-binding protein
MNRFKNKILQNLQPDVIQRLELREVKLEQNREVERPGEPIENLIFIESGIGSLTVTFKDGSQVEAGLFGYESVMGASALMGTKKSLNKVYMQASGEGYACRTTLAEREFARHERFHDLILRFVQAQLIQTMQSAGCNGTHDADQRLARWILLCHDRTQSDVLPLTHEFLSHMLGTRRTTVTLAAQSLQFMGLIEYHRGTVRILDVPGLERISCECYRVVKDHLDNFTEMEQEQDSNERAATR